MRRRARTPKTAPAGESSESGTKTEEAPRRKRKFPYRKVYDLEEEIASAEARIAELEAEMAKSDFYRDGQRVRETREHYDEIRTQLARLYEHWEEAVELN